MAAVIVAFATFAVVAVDDLSRALWAILLLPTPLCPIVSRSQTWIDFGAQEKHAAATDAIRLPNKVAYALQKPISQLIPLNSGPSHQATKPQAKRFNKRFNKCKCKFHKKHISIFIFIFINFVILRKEGERSEKRYQLSQHCRSYHEQTGRTGGKMEGRKEGRTTVYK